MILAFLLAALIQPPPGMVLVPEGEFWMGRYYMWLIDEIGWQARDRVDDRPMHQVRLDAFYIDTYEVTNEAYARFVEATRHRKPFHWRKGDVPGDKPALPVYNVSWDDAAAYCGWAGKRLPTEAEWEKAARGGVDNRNHPWGDDLEPVDESAPPAEQDEEPKTLTMAHYGYPEGPVAVGQFPPNDLGLFDVIGNVWEWVADGYELHYYSVTPRENPVGPEGAPYKVFRGGSWGDHDDRLLSVFYRNFTDPTTRTNTIGFRCAQDSP